MFTYNANIERVHWACADLSDLGRPHMKRLRVKLEWIEKHSTLEEFDAMDDGTPVGSQLGHAMGNAWMRCGLDQRSNIIPESIKFTLVKDD